MSVTGPFAGIVFRTDDALDRDEVRLESGNPDHWVTLNLQTRRLVVVRADRVEETTVSDV